jgi:serine/threonine protein kinase
LKYRGTEQAVLEELKILAKLEHNNILRYYSSWSEPAEYHKQRDEELFKQSDISTSRSFTTSDTSTRMGRTCDDNRDVRSFRTNNSDDINISFESPSSENQPATSMTIPSIDNTTSSQNDQTEEKEQKKSKSYEYLFIVTSLCKNESLEDRLLPEYRSKNKINRFDALYIFCQIVEGVRYLHNTMDMVIYFLILVLLVTLVFSMILFRFIVI